MELNTTNDTFDVSTVAALRGLTNVFRVVVDAKNISETRGAGDSAWN